MRLRDLPSVDELARGVDDPLAVEAARTVIAERGRRSRRGPIPATSAKGCARSSARARRPRLRRVLNATGVIVHTNLGRAPLARAALDRVEDVARGYSNLEYDLTAGTRGSRQDHAADILRRLTGSRGALVVNNNAAAVMLALAALAEGRDVLVSRGELIEIGDGFRIPDVLARSGARLREIGTTNRTRAADYENAITPDTAVLLRVHQSNFRVVGFTEQADSRATRGDRATPRAPARRRPRLGVLVSSSDTLSLGEEPSARRASRPGPTSSPSPATSCSADRRRASSSAAPISSSVSADTRSQRALRSGQADPRRARGNPLAVSRSARAAREVPVLRMLMEDATDVRTRAERLARSSAARSRRPSPGSAAARCRLPRSRASPAPWRRSSPRRSVPPSHRWSGSYGTGSCCSTAAR